MEIRLEIHILIYVICIMAYNRLTAAAFVHKDLYGVLFKRYFPVPQSTRYIIGSTVRSSLSIYNSSADRDVLLRRIVKVMSDNGNILGNGKSSFSECFAYSRCALY